MEPGYMERPKEMFTGERHDSQVQQDLVLQRVQSKYSSSFTTTPAAIFL
jgi:hypothetical protein